MSTIKISQLPSAATLSSTDVSPWVQAGVTVKAKLADEHGGMVSITDYGASPTATAAANTTAIHAALNSGAHTIFAPAGSYTVNTITIPSNVTLYGEGSSTVFVAASGLNATVLTTAANSVITLRSFAVDGNSAGQTSDGYGILVDGGYAIRLYDVVVSDTFSFGFCFKQGTSIWLKNCECYDIKGTTDPNGTVACYLFGASAPSLTYCYDVFVDGCIASSTIGTYTNGFMLEQGSRIHLSNCYSTTSYANYKIKTSYTEITNCIAYGGYGGFGTQAATQSLTLVGNQAYFANDSGFSFNIPSGTAYDWVVSNNISYDNGQAPSSTSYGFAFELTAGATLDRLVLAGNTAASQQRGFSFAATGTITHANITGNVAVNNTADWVNAGSLDMATATLGGNVGYGSGAVAFNAASAGHRLNFWMDNIAAGAGETLINDGVGTRGYLMPRAGYLRGVYVKANDAVTAGSMTIVLRKNGSLFGDGTVLSTGTYASTEMTPQQHKFAAGDLLQCIYVSDAGLLPAGTDDITVMADVVYA